MEQIKTLGLVLNFYKTEVVELGQMIAEQLSARDIQIIAPSEDADALGLPRLTNAQFAQAADAVLVVGGDGTLLRAARTVYGYHKPLLGVNKGYLGFLTEVEMNELEDYLGAFLSGDFQVERRMMLTAEVYRNGQKLRELTGLNDLVITKGALARIISVEIEMDGAMVDQFLGDGVIFSTSTGSTGYSLSAGGPIVYPNFDVCILAPICPHSLSARSMIFPPESVLRVHLGLENFQAMLTVDGQYGMELENKDEILIRKADDYTYLVKMKDRNFFQVMRDKLKAGGSGKKYN